MSRISSPVALSMMGWPTKDAPNAWDTSPSTMSPSSLTARGTLTPLFFMATANSCISSMVVGMPRPVASQYSLLTTGPMPVLAASELMVAKGTMRPSSVTMSL